MLGTGTNSVLHVGTGTIVCGTCTTASANVPPHCSTSRNFSTAAAINRNDLHSFSGHEPYKKCAQNYKTCTSTKTQERSKAPILTQNESKILAEGIKIRYKCCHFMYSTPTFCEDREVLEILKEVVEEGQMYLHRLRVGVENEVVHKEELVLQR